MPATPKLELPPKYCEYTYQTNRRPTRTVMVNSQECGRTFFEARIPSSLFSFDTPPLDPFNHTGRQGPRWIPASHCQADHDHHRHP